MTHQHSRQHYRAFASIISSLRKGLSSTNICGRDTIYEFETECMEQFAKDNPRFNRAKFLEAAK